MARRNFLRDIAELRAAVGLILQTSANHSKGVGVLRRGAAITGLVMLETFVRDRINEILHELQAWPGQYDDLPQKFRRRATIEALGHLERYARMLERQGADFEREVIDEAGLIASMSPPSFQFTKYFAGDYTGNISVGGIRELLRVFHIGDCWRGMTSFCSDIGFGVPSIEQVLQTIVGNRHRSAHAAGFSPAAGDVEELPTNLNLVAICLDAALSSSLTSALTDWRKWSANQVDWRTGLELFFLVPKGSQFRLKRKDAIRATRIVNKAADARAFLPRKSAAITRLLVEQSPDGRPMAWDIV